MDNSRSSYYKIYNAVVGYFNTYEEDYLAISEFINDHIKGYNDTIGYMRNNLFHQLNNVILDLETVLLVKDDENMNYDVVYQIVANLENCYSLSTIYWNALIHFNTSLHSHTPDNMFIEGDVRSCNTTQANLYGVINEILDIVDSPTFGSRFSVAVGMLGELVELYRSCTCEYINKLESLNRKMDAISPSHIEEISVKIETLLRDMNIHELHLPLIQVSYLIIISIGFKQLNLSDLQKQSHL